MLSNDALKLLLEALEDRRRAWAAWHQAAEAFGPPFEKLEASAARQREAFAALFAAHGLPLPPEPPTSTRPPFASRAEACQWCAAAERATLERCERLLDVTRQVELATLFRQLQTASRERHLPALERCADAGRPRQRCG